MFGTISISDPTAHKLEQKDVLCVRVCVGCGPVSKDFLLHFTVLCEKGITELKEIFCSLY